MNNEIIVSKDYNRAVELTRKIQANASAAQNSMLEICKAVAEMREGKLYKELGYQNFADYCECELNIHRNQGIKYARIGTTLTTENAQSLGISENLGTEKLYLLSMFEPEERQEVVQNVDLEKTTVKELKAEIDKLNEEKAGFKERQDKLLTRNKQLVSELETAGKKLDKTESDLDEARDTVQNLEKQLQELESKPRDSFEDLTKINELTAKLNEEQERHTEELERLRSEYEKQPEIIKDNKAIFKAYMQATVDSMKHLTAFCEQNSDSPDRTLFIEKLETIMQLTNRTITKLKGES